MSDPIESAIAAHHSTQESESDWMERVYHAGEAKVDRDPDLDATANAGEIISASLEELVLILDEQKPHDAVKFIRQLIN